MKYQEILNNGLSQLGLNLESIKLEQYLELLDKWNHAYNLTAVRDLDSMVTKHILDSLAILPFIKGKSLLDVGTGAGLPGIPLAIALPHLKIVLLDSNGKKIRFLQEVKRKLKLDNVEIIQSRVESYHPTALFDTLTSRAFSAIEQMLNLSRHLIVPDGIWVLMKGRRPDDELAAIKMPSRVESYAVPGIDGERCCVIIENN